MESVLITGGAGFVGSHAAEFYDNKGVEVTVVDNLSRESTLADADEDRDTATYNWNYLIKNHPDVELIQADVRNSDSMESLVDGHDAIIHTAGQVAVTSSLENPVTDHEINITGTLNILESARQADSDPSVVFASTNKVYGDNINKIPVREMDTRYIFDDEEFTDGISESVSIDQCEHTPYGVSKLAADQYVQDYAERGEVDTAVFRMSCIYGPRQFGNEDQGWVAHFGISAIEDEELTIFGDGKQVRDVLYVKDLIRAYDQFLSNPDVKSGVYNIGGGSINTTSLIELLDLLEETTSNRPSVVYDEWREGDQRVYISDISKAKSELNWQPKVSLQQGIKRFVDWYRTTQ